MSHTSEIVPMGDNVRRKSFGLFLWSGVFTEPGATALKRIFSFAYSLARLKVIASMPPLVIMGTEAVTPAMGFAASAAVMLTTLPPDFCFNICLTAAWVTQRKPSRLVEESALKSS